MFIEERHREILKLLDELGSINTSLIQRKFSISYDSAKRDLRILEEKGLLKRTHGGAISLRQAELGTVARSSPSERAKYAVSLISDGDFVFIDHTAEGIELVREITDGMNIRAATNSPAAAELLRRKLARNVMLLGGEIDSQGGCFDGFAVDMIKKLRFDKCFICTDGISFDFGISVKDSTHIQFYSELINASKKVIGLYPADRIGKDSLFSVSAAASLDCIISENAQKESISELREMGIRIINCEMYE